jgi:hypothetical protein
MYSTKSESLFDLSLSHPRRRFLPLLLLPLISRVVSTQDTTPSAQAVQLAPLQVTGDAV